MKMVEENDNIKVFHTIERVKDEEKKWEGGIGYISTEMIKENIWSPDDDVAVLYCGPPPFNKSMKSQLEAIGYPASNVHKF